jgi:CBS-domain-containing membrane protein
MIRQVVSIEPGKSVGEAVAIMTEHNISSLIVATEGTLHGIITEKDVLTRVVAKGANPADTRVIDIMSPTLITVTPDTPLEDANRLMVEKRIKKLPVVEPSSNHLLGILSATDFARLQPRMIEEAKKAAQPASDTFIHRMDEGQHLEFKATLRYDLAKKCVNPDLEQVILKTVTAFMNADGGDLVIGISDDKKPLGLKEDYQTLRVPSRDGFENKLISLISAKVGDSFLRFVKIAFPIVEGVEVCKISIAPSTEPVFMTENGQEHFYVRTGNNSRPFSLSDTTRYVMERWR